MSSLPLLSSCPVEEWRYVAEGGANLVVAYAGGASTSTSASAGWADGTVLRVRKRALASDKSEDASPKEEDASVAFTARVVLPLLPPESTPRLFSRPVDPDWLARLAEHIEPARPASRRAVDCIDTGRGYVVQADNLVGQPGGAYQQLSVEIKPKWGFLPRAKYLSGPSRAIKTQHCRFCLHQLHRSAASAGHGQGQHSVAREYCPLDLYSGDEERVERAVKALVKSWCAADGKGNNLKMFWEGKMVKPDEVADTGILGELADLEDAVSRLLVPFLASTPILQRLATLQSNLDCLDIEGLETKIHDQLGVRISNLTDSVVERVGGEVSLPEYEGFVKRWGRTVTQQRERASDGTDTTTPAVFDESSASLRELIVGYLLSATFKDCSMIVCIHKPRASQEDARKDDVDAAGSSTRTSCAWRAGAGGVHISASLVDCDVKSVDRLKKWKRLDEDIVRSFSASEQAGGAQLSPCLL